MNREAEFSRRFHFCVGLVVVMATYAGAVLALKLLIS